MQQVKVMFSRRVIGCPKIGAGLAKGDWTTIAAMIDQELVGEAMFRRTPDHATMVDESVRDLRVLARR
jgi:hypothetical protein